MSSLQDQITKLAQQKLAFLQQSELEEERLRQEQQKAENLATDPFKNRNLPHSPEYRRFLQDRIAYYTRFVNIFDLGNQHRQEFSRYSKQYFQGYSTTYWETRKFFLQTVAQVLANPRYSFGLTGYSEYAIGGKVFKTDRQFYLAFCNALGFDPDISTRHFREFLDLWLTDQMPKTELDWKLLTDPVYKQSPVYDKTKMHPSEASTSVMLDAFDSFGDVADELNPDAIAELTDS